MDKFRIDWGVPSSGTGGALVPALATWELNGKPDRLDCRVTKRADGEDDMRIPIRVNKGMGADAIIGKAERKVCHRVYEIITGISLPSVDEDEPNTDADPNTIDSTGNIVSSADAQDSVEGQTLVHDLDEVYRQYVDDINNSETMDESMQAKEKFFGKDAPYKWSDDQRSKALRVLEKRHDKIRLECGKGTESAKSTKGQKQFV